MQDISLYKGQSHRFILLNESEPGEENGIPSNQYLIIHENTGILLDPGGFGVMPRVLSELLKYLKPEQIGAIVLSHQDPDIVGGLSTWMELTQASVYVSSIWTRFIPHYGISDMGRFIGIADEGELTTLAPGFEARFVPAHFLHSPGHINLYDPIAKILFSGDIGAALMPEGDDTIYVDDLSTHLSHIEGFHKRYMASNRALRCWVQQLESLGIDMIAPQHGPIYRGKAVSQLMSWLAQLQCGSDLMELRKTS